MKKQGSRKWLNPFFWDLMLSSCLQAKGWPIHPVSSHFGVLLHGFQPLHFHAKDSLIVSDTLRFYTIALWRMRISAGVPEVRAGIDPRFLLWCGGGKCVAEGHGAFWLLLYQTLWKRRTARETSCIGDSFIYRNHLRFRRNPSIQRLTQRSILNFKMFLGTKLIFTEPSDMT